jgi:hypothetical protein
MKTKKLYLVALTFLFVMASYPVYAGEYHPMGGALYSNPSIFAPESNVVSTTGAVGTTGWQLKEVCQYDWEIIESGELYEEGTEGSRTFIACVHPRHNLGGG